MVKALLLGQMAESTSENGKMANTMVKALVLCQMEAST